MARKPSPKSQTTPETTAEEAPTPEATTPATSGSEPAPAELAPDDVSNEIAAELATFDAADHDELIEDATTATVEIDADGEVIEPPKGFQPCGEEQFWELFRDLWGMPGIVAPELEPLALQEDELATARRVSDRLYGYILTSKSKLLRSFIDLNSAAIQDAVLLAAFAQTRIRQLRVVQYNIAVARQGPPPVDPAPQGEQDAA